MFKPSPAAQGALSFTIHVMIFPRSDDARCSIWLFFYHRVFGFVSFNSIRLTLFDDPRFMVVALFNDLAARRLMRDVG